MLIVNCTSSIVQAQNKTLDSLKNIVSSIEGSINNLPQKVSWDYMPIDSALFYNVYYCAANDTSLMPIHSGSNLDDVWDWQTGSTVYNYFWVKKTSLKYLRIGIAGVNQAGKTTAMRCTTYVNF
jgi:hypothetical protein